MNRAMKFRIELNNDQREMLAKTFGCCRFLYNQMLRDRMSSEIIDSITIKPRPAMYKDDYPWLREVDSLALANVQLHLEKAFRDYSAHRTGHPRYKSKHCSRQSYTTNVVNGNIRIEGKRIRLPKVGMVKMRAHRDIPDDWKLKSVTVSMEASDKYYASLLFEVPEVENQAEEKREEDKSYLGIDYAMNGLAVLSTGAHIEYPGFFKASEGRLAREQRKELVKVDRFFPSSKRCSCCRRIRDDLTLGDRIYECGCGNYMDRDVNAAINIREEARRLKTA